MRWCDGPVYDGRTTLALEMGNYRTGMRNKLRPKDRRARSSSTKKAHLWTSSHMAKDLQRAVFAKCELFLEEPVAASEPGIARRDTRARAESPPLGDTFSNIVGNSSSSARCDA